MFSVKFNRSTANCRRTSAACDRTKREGTNHLEWHQAVTHNWKFNPKHTSPVNSPLWVWRVAVSPGAQGAPSRCVWRRRALGCPSRPQSRSPDAWTDVWSSTAHRKKHKREDGSGPKRTQEEEKKLFHLDLPWHFFFGFWSKSGIFSQLAHRQNYHFIFSHRFHWGVVWLNQQI